MNPEIYESVLNALTERLKQKDANEWKLREIWEGSNPGEEYTTNLEDFEVGVSRIRKPHPNSLGGDDGRYEYRIRVNGTAPIMDWGGPDIETLFSGVDDKFSEARIPQSESKKLADILGVE